MFNFSVSFYHKNARWSNVLPVTYSQKTMFSRVNSHDLSGQATHPVSPTQHLCSRFTSSFIPQNHHTWDSQLLMPHKHNPNTETNKLTVTATIFHRLPYSCAWHLLLFNHGKQTFMGCMKDFPGLFNIHVSSEHTSWLRLHTDLKNIPVTLRYSEPVTQPANVQVFSNRRHCTLSACSTTMCL